MASNFVNSRRGDITTERVLRLCTSEWQKVEDLMPELMGTVPSGFALRTYEQRTAKVSKGIKPITEDEKIMSGKRTIANSRIISMLNSGRVEQRKDPDKTRWIRLTESEQRRIAEEEAASRVCHACQRPFPQATESQDPAPSRTITGQTVLYPAFPQWDSQQQAVT